MFYFDLYFADDLRPSSEEVDRPQCDPVKRIEKELSGVLPGDGVFPNIFPRDIVLPMHAGIYIYFYGPTSSIRAYSFTL